MNKRIIPTYGAISGVVSAAVFILASKLAMAEGALGRISGYVGYLLMLVALSVIFLGIKRYRDLVYDGDIRFGQALLAGLAISLVAGVVYMACWEIYLATDDTFLDEYTQGFIEGKKVEGVDGEELEAVIRSMETLKERHANPVARIVMSFLELFPFGFIVSLISAAILRNSKVLPATRQSA